MIVVLFTFCCCCWHVYGFTHPELLFRFSEVDRYVSSLAIQTLSIDASSHSGNGTVCLPEFGCASDHHCYLNNTYCDLMNKECLCLDDSLPGPGNLSSVLIYWLVSDRNANYGNKSNVTIWILSTNISHPWR